MNDLEREADEWAHKVTPNMESEDPKTTDFLSRYRESLRRSYIAGAQVTRHKITIRRHELINSVFFWSSVTVLVMMAAVQFYSKSYFAAAWALGWSGFIVYMRVRELKSEEGRK